MKIEPARREQARDIALLINLAGEGIPEYLWQGMAEDGQTPLDVGEQRAGREGVDFSYLNARVCTDDTGDLLGMLLGYLLADPYDLQPDEEYPDFLVPLVHLEAQAAGSWYVNAVATFEQARGRGVATALFADAHRRATEAGCSHVSLIVASENPNAQRLYETLGYAVQDSRPVVPHPGSGHGGEWRLMTCSV